MNNPLVTILSPCYNVGQFLPNYFDTVLRQTYANLQVVLIDDGSKDNTRAVMQEYADKDSRVEVYHQENQGVSATRNNLLDKVKGDYVLFVDSDDWIELDMVENLVGVALEYSSKFVMCDRVTNDNKPKDDALEIKILSQEQAVHDFLRHEYFIGSLCNKLLSSRLFHNERFHCGISYGEDALFCWRVLQKVDKVVVTDRQLYHYRMNDGSISHETFGPKKFSGQLTWQIVSDESEKHWPNYSYLANAQLAIQNIDLLHYASKEDYHFDNMISSLQENTRKYFLDLIKARRTTIIKLLYGFFISRWYGFGKIAYRLFGV